MTDPKLPSQIIIQNPDEPVNLGPDPIDDDGVIENVPDDPNPVTIDEFPKPSNKGEAL